ncbi:Peptidase S28 [Akanthomyces lecanii RCEF 1005]|uniref:Peptidase S28 n=1 Tax=Akanthomyces lecanii RCEF 1005 TaxID=1081108 RepID=A0A168FCM5_CORDF|nr:Peptidase S28 [Akanthomyces lecanii RCEF 1005]
MRLSTLTAAIGFAGVGEALRGPMPIKSVKAVTKVLGAGEERKQSTVHATMAYFDQLIDHNRPGLGTFKQRYYYSTDYWQGPGSPISMEAPSENPLELEDVFLTNRTMVGLIAQSLGGAAVILEHRFYGDSHPPQEGTQNTEYLQPLTLENSIDDLVYFARNAELPFDPEGASHPDKAPWTLCGCSYAGALSAWTEKIAPGTFWAYEAGSAVVEARSSLWQYFEVIEEAMPRNCSADWKRVMANIDHVLMHGSASDKDQLKQKMGVANYTDKTTAEFATQWLGSWQDQQYGMGYSEFFQMCDYIENQLPEKYEAAPGPDGLGLEKALEGYFRGLQELGEVAKYGGPVLEIEFPYPWNWQLCNEPLEWWPTERPDRPLHITTGYDTEQSLRQAVCIDAFPDVGKYKVGVQTGRNEHAVNRLTSGWRNHNATRLVWVNANLDPWLYATVSSPDRPGGPLQSTEDAPLYMLRGGSHCNDYPTQNAAANGDARIMFDGVATNMKKWATEFYRLHNVTRKF